MLACEGCGIGFHPEISKCPVCGMLRPKERARRNKLQFLINTIAVSFVATVVLVRAVAGTEIAVGMSANDCDVAKNLAAKTRVLAQGMESNPQAIDGLKAVAGSWAELASHYTPGKYSWSSSGLEHNWLQRLAQSTEQLASGDEVATEGGAEPKSYVVELTRLLPRYCN